MSWLTVDTPVELYSTSGVKLFNHNLTGNPSELEGKLKRSISAFNRSGSKVDSFYLGVTSLDASTVSTDVMIRALKAAHYQNTGFNEIYCMYSSTSQNHADTMKTVLVEHYKVHDKCENINVGGGPKANGATLFFVYLALKRTTE